MHGSQTDAQKLYKDSFIHSRNIRPRRVTRRVTRSKMANDNEEVKEDFICNWRDVICARIEVSRVGHFLLGFHCGKQVFPHLQSTCSNLNSLEDH